MEIENAVNQSKKELANRFDFKGSNADILLEKNEIKLSAEDQFKLKALAEIVMGKLAKRQISLKNVEKLDPDVSPLGHSRQVIKIKQGLESTIAKQVTGFIRETKLKVTTQIQGEEIRVTGKSRDDLAGRDRCRARERVSGRFAIPEFSRLMRLGREEFIEVVERTPLVSIDLIVRRADGRVLLGKRTNEPAKGCWFVPGGRIHKNERLACAFRRICEAELGKPFALTDAKFLGVFEHLYPTNFAEKAGTGTHYVVLAYELHADDLPESLPADQHGEFDWFDVQRILKTGDVHENTRADFCEPAFEVLCKARLIKVCNRVVAKNCWNLLHQSFNDDFLSARMVGLPHLFQVEHHVHEDRLFLPREAKSALKVQFWIATHQDDCNTMQADSVISRNEVPSCWAGHFINDLAHT